jgi:hypothetical protein
MIDRDKVGFTLSPLSAMMCSRHFSSMGLAPNAAAQPRLEAGAQRAL